MKRVINGKTYSKVLGIKQGSLLTAGKDGDIEEYKADPTDAGKVLTVGEDGGVAPAEGGGNDLYRHDIKYQGVSSPYLSFSVTLINDSSTPFTKETLKDYIVNNHRRSVNPTVYKYLSCCGAVRPVPTGECLIFNGIEQHPEDDKIIVSGGFVGISNGSLAFSNGESSISWSSIGAITDTVVAV